MTNISQIIKNKLSEIERKENIRIIYACESGSRAWGFASEDSDYDVRFIYVRPLEEYLRLDKTSDVLEIELNEIYDINGWDIKKLFTLLANSNNTIYEWADSPIVYKTTDEWEYIKPLLKEYFSEQKALHHYLSMGKQVIKNYFRGEEVVLKKYFYVLRPILACMWIMEKNCPAPTDFNILKEVILPKNLTSSVEKLLFVKTHSSEKQTGLHIEDLDFYINSTTIEIEEYLQKDFPKTKIDWKKLNQKFLEIVTAK